MEILLAALMSCSDIQNIIESVRGDKYLKSDAKKEIVEILIQGTPQCELNEGSEITG